MESTCSTVFCPPDWDAMAPPWSEGNAGICATPGFGTITLHWMQAATSGNDLFAGLQVQVIGVGEHHLGAGARQLFGADAFDSGQGADGHESRGLHGPMGGMEGAAAGSRVGTTGADVEAEQSRIPTGLNLR